MSRLPDRSNDGQDAEAASLELVAHERLKPLFLLPLSVVLAVIIGVVVEQAYSNEREEILRSVRLTQGAMRELFGSAIEQSTATLGSTMASLRHNPALRDAFARGDRELLLERSAPLFEELRTYAITHWYFSDGQALNLLRVHLPKLHGDRITRLTTHQAVQSGKLASGIELGPAGTLTHRLVEPWYSGDDALMGYVELGSEIDVIMQRMEGILGSPLYLLTRKRFLSPSLSKGDMGMDHVTDWDRFPDFVIAHGEAMPAALARELQSGFPAQGQVLQFTEGKRAYRGVGMFVEDAGDRQVAAILAIVDVSEAVRAGRRVLLRGGIVGGLAGGILIALFYWMLDSVEGRLEGHQAALRQLATHDELTGLPNRRSFYARLNGEFRRSVRYQRPLSLLLVDIDYFKAVNDTYGHAIGDDVLQEVTGRIRSAIRAVDTAFRYGGEELVVLLPETPLALAMETAERIRESIADRPFVIGEDESLTLSVSIGGASYPHHGNVDALVAAADRAMYSAKQKGRNRVWCEQVPGDDPAG